MKKTILLSTILAAALLFYKPADAQIRVHVNINLRPVFGYAYPSWHNSNEVVFSNDRGRGHYDDRRDFDRRDWGRDHDRFDDRRYDDRYARDDRRHDDYRGHDDFHRDHGRGRW